MKGLRTVLRRYEQWLKDKPNVANMCSAALVTGIGDCGAQYIERTYGDQFLPQKIKKKEPSTADRGALRYRTETYNWRRTCIYASFIFVSTPVWLRVYALGDRLIGGKTSIMHAFTQGLFTWGLGAVFNPLFTGYVCTMSAVWMHGIRSREELVEVFKERMRTNYVTHISSAFAFWMWHWIPLFYLLPPHFRLLYSSFVQIGWNAVASFIQHR